MANTVATLVIKTELLPTQSTTSLSPFPSLLTSGEEGEEDGEREDEQQLEKEAGQVVLTEVEMVPPPAAPQNPEHPFQCMDCGKTFKWSSRLAHHQRSHNNERPYRCNLCPKAFKGSSALLYHQRSHSGEKPYKCEDCGKAFKRSSLLQPNRWTRQHHCTASLKHSLGKNLNFERLPRVQNLALEILSSYHSFWVDYSDHPQVS